MDIFKIVAIGIITCIANIIIKQIKPEYSVLIVLSGGLIILLLIINSISNSMGSISGIFNVLKIDNVILKSILKILGIGYLVEFGAGICNDTGHSSLAEKIVLAGKVAILIMCMPIVKNLIELLIEIMP